jgi:hypothetical protein
MISTEITHYLKDLYENIFGESTNNSKEFTTFVKDENPHPLRIKVEDELANLKEGLVDQDPPYFANNFLQPLAVKISYLIELDTFITNYIDSHD